MSDVIVLSSDEDDHAISLPFQEVEMGRSFVEDEDFDYGSSASFEGFSPHDKPGAPSQVNNGGIIQRDPKSADVVKAEPNLDDELSFVSEDLDFGTRTGFDALPITSGINGTNKKPETRPRVIHDLSDSDDDLSGPSTLCQKSPLQSSDDELPCIDINLPLNVGVQRKTTYEDYGMTKEKPRVPATKREEQQQRKQLQLAEKEKQRQAKQEEREKKKREAAQAKANKQLIAEIERSKSKEECLKWITATIDTGLLEADYSGDLLSALRTNEINYKVEECIIPCSVLWERRVLNMHIDDNVVAQKTTVIQNEPFILIVWMWSKLISEIHETTLQSTVEEMVSLLPDKELTLVIFGLEEYLRFQKTQKRREVRSEVLGSGPPKRKAKEGSVEAAPAFSPGDVEFALVEVQVRFNVNHKIINSKADLANLVCQFSKSIAEAPLKDKRQKNEERLDWFASADSRDCVAVAKDGIGTLQLWHRQLSQFPLASRETSEAIVAMYPSPLSLLKAYENCSSEEEAQLLLEDIPVRRGPGPLSSSRRIGPQLSKKVHTFFTSFDDSCVIATE